ncbi:TlpA disulfide reductase family protein [Streptomyces sp. DSM 42041]|uniref:TlpA disulfide reductase family protein n=1 Tax=Streptomyces hazeniae TaxID=3075538 RepID=A0ABU2NWX5_9ACTN|nr:TlpA disulfide reductase family protein [Streptomyces sp. DSM 42041]MDT0380708.1 TlpA disulfide reductase family protein [Streptomyces sp. DSM 42041]
MSPIRAFRRRTPLSAAAVLVVAGGLLLTGCGDDPKATGGGDKGYVQGTGRITKVPAAERKDAPDIGGETVGDGRARLSDFRGEVVVVNVWGSWCAPCRAEAPHFAKVAEDMTDDGVRFLGINTRDQYKEPAQAFERTYGIPYPSLFDPSGRQMLKFPKGTLSLQTIPSTLIIDRDGKIAVQALDELGGKQLRSLIEPVLAEK